MIGALRQLKMIGDAIVDAFQIMGLAGNFFRPRFMGDETSAFQQDQLSLLQLRTVNCRLDHPRIGIVQRQ